MFVVLYCIFVVCNITYRYVLPTGFQVRTVASCMVGVVCFALLYSLWRMHAVAALTRMHPSLLQTSTLPKNNGSHANKSHGKQSVGHRRKRRKNFR